jgi:hypothetical protein
MVGTVLKLAGLLITFVFWIYEVRIAAYMKHFEKRVSELEGRLGYNIYSGRLKMRSPLPFVRSQVATPLLFICFAVFWIAFLFFQ